MLQIEPPEIIAKPTRQARHTAFERTTNKKAITKRKYTKRTKNNNKPIQQEKPKNKYNLVVESTVDKEYKKRDNTYSKPYRETVIQAKEIYADTVEEAKQIAIDEVAENLQMVDSPVITSVVSSEVTSDVFIDDGGEPTSGMMMRNSQVVNYNDIKDCKEYDTRVGMCVIDNFMGVYGDLIKKLTREKLIAECRHFYKQHDPEPLRDNNGNIML